MRAGVVAVAMFTIVAIAPTPATGEPVHLRSRSTCTTAAGSHVELEPSYVLDEPAWDALDLEVKRLQERETRLAAENQALRNGGHGGGWVIGMMLGLAAGIGLGLTL